MHIGFGVLPKASVLWVGRRRDRSPFRGEAPQENGCDPSAGRPLSPDVGSKMFYISIEKFGVLLPTAARSKTPIFLC